MVESSGLQQRGLRRNVWRVCLTPTKVTGFPFQSRRKGGNEILKQGEAYTKGLAQGKFWRCPEGQYPCGFPVCRRGDRQLTGVPG